MTTFSNPQCAVFADTSTKQFFSSCIKKLKDIEYILTDTYIILNGVFVLVSGFAGIVPFFSHKEGQVVNFEKHK